MNYLVKLMPTQRFLYNGKHYYENQEVELVVSQSEVNMFKQYCKIISASPCEDNTIQKKVKNNVTSGK